MLVFFWLLSYQAYQEFPLGTEAEVAGQGVPGGHRGYTQVVDEIALVAQFVLKYLLLGSQGVIVSRRWRVDEVEHVRCRSRGKAVGRMFNLAADRLVLTEIASKWMETIAGFLQAGQSPIDGGLLIAVIDADRSLGVGRKQHGQSDGGKLQPNQGWRVSEPLRSLLLGPAFS